nr:Mobile element protein [Escherichia coli]
MRSWQTETDNQRHAGFKSMKTAYATIKGIEVMRALRKGRPQHFIMVIQGEVSEFLCKAFERQKAASSLTLQQCQPNIPAMIDLCVS